VADLKPAYLIEGDDDAKIDDWRTRIRARAEREAATATFEALTEDRTPGDEVAAAIGALTLAVGRRYVLAEGVENWKEKDVAPVVAALKALPPDTVVVLIATGKVTRKGGPASLKLAKAVAACGGEVKTYASPTLGRLPAWVIDRGKERDLAIDRDAAQALVERIGQDQRRLVRELEKIAIYAPDGGRVDVELVEELTVPDVEAKAYELADALIDGDRGRALALAEDLQVRGTDIMHILYALLRRTNEMRRAWAVIETGGTSDDVAAALGLRQAWMVKKLVPRAREVDGERLERIAAGLADLDYAIRGGGKVDTGTALTLTLAATA
jgi:DNA polymerase III subunit delta